MSRRARLKVGTRTSGIPQRQLHVFPIYLDVRNIVFKDGGHVDLAAKQMKG